MTSVLGIHHVTAIASDPQRNVDFYCGVLGMRLVKRTVNFDDPQTYHFYYGDETGSPGSILTFFPMPDARRGRVGSGQVAVTAFAVQPHAIAFWIDRLMRAGIACRGPEKRGLGAELETVLAFKDPDGLLLEIVGHAGAAARPAWGGAPGIAQDVALRGFHSVAMWVEESEATASVLTQTLGFRLVSEDGASKRFAILDGGPGNRVELRAIGGFGRGLGGAGTVHHVAWCVSDDDAEMQVREQVIAAGLHPTTQVDRNYFHSVYFREPGGVLFELATIPPGFAIDEVAEHLGEALKLPPQYESERATIERVLPPIHMPGEITWAKQFADTAAGEGEDPTLGFLHRWIPAAAEGGSGTPTLLLLHGTGGDEDDLLPLGRALWPGAALLSPRGNVLERGAPRFFKRLREGVFDLDDLAKRSVELSAFVEDASRAYGFDRSNVIAVGFSNGANIAANLLLTRGGIFKGAILLSPMLPFEPAPPPSQSGTHVFIGAGRADATAPIAQAEHLTRLLQGAGADVTMYTHDSGHTLTPEELAAARDWLDAFPRS